MTNIKENFRFRFHFRSVKMDLKVTSLSRLLHLQLKVPFGTSLTDELTDKRYVLTSCVFHCLRIRLNVME